ncbi:Longevity-assurance protein [Onchocerca flexuosa]|uniref:Longevity-assurance protein n=1 Tax=Onchocerca flexuosa TaxID=387005 RepID=A0A238BLN9_9BILA|nr:Longevity-assurance protein [Onchocerca flexuosa]
MTIHHIITIVLLLFSFVMNLVRIGTLILFTHDIADIFLELGKLCRYAKWETALPIFFAIFAIVWIITRLIYFPFFIIRSILRDAPPVLQLDYQWGNLLQPPIVPRLFVIMLLCLMTLHIYWTFIIIKIALKSVQSNLNIDDIREESDYEISDSSSENTDTVIKKNMKEKKIE